jgi:hypothetical protein
MGLCKHNLFISKCMCYLFVRMRNWTVPFVVYLTLSYYRTAKVSLAYFLTVAYQVVLQCSPLATNKLLLIEL